MLGFKPSQIRHAVANKMQRNSKQKCQLLLQVVGERSGESDSIDRGDRIRLKRFKKKTEFIDLKKKTRPVQSN